MPNFITKKNMQKNPIKDEYFFRPADKTNRVISQKFMNKSTGFFFIVTSVDFQ